MRALNSSELALLNEANLISQLEKGMVMKFGDLTLRQAEEGSGFTIHKGDDFVEHFSSSIEALHEIGQLIIADEEVVNT